MNQTSLEEEQRSREQRDAFRRSDEYAEHVINIGQRNSLSVEQLDEIMAGVRASVRLSYGFLADPYTAFSIEDTIRVAILGSATFRHALAFSISTERLNAGIMYSADITHLHYRNLYRMRDDTDHRRIDQLSLTEILTSSRDTVPILPREILGCEDERDVDTFVGISIAPNYDSVQYPFWQAGLMHEIIHGITDAGDPPYPEQNSRLGPTEILSNQIASEMSWSIPIFDSYRSFDRHDAIEEYEFQSLRQGIMRHHGRAYELLERLCEIAHVIGSINFRGIDTLSSDDLSLAHTSDEDTPEHWGAFLLAGAHATCRRKDVFVTKNKNIVFNGELPLTQWHLNKYGLVIAEMVVSRAEYGSGFYKKKYKSWKEWYQSLQWKTLLGYGVHDYGLTEAEGYLIYSPYGEIFEDGSFSVGVTGADVKKCGYNDNWTRLAGNDWSVFNYSGQMYFDKHGRPVAIAITDPRLGYFGSGWSFLYVNGKWEYEAKDDWDKRRFANRTESLDLHAPRFLIKNI